MSAAKTASTRLVVSGAGRDLLYRPAVAVGVLEEDEPDVVEWIGHRSGVLTEDPYVTDRNAPCHQFLMRASDVGNYELQALEGPGGHLGNDPFADDDGASRSGWGELYYPSVIADGGVVIDGESQLMVIEVLGPVDV